MTRLSDFDCFYTETLCSFTVWFVLRICSQMQIKLSQFSCDMLKSGELPNNKETPLHSIYGSSIETESSPGLMIPSALDLISFLYPRALNEKEKEKELNENSQNSFPQLVCDVGNNFFDVPNIFLVLLFLLLPILLRLMYCCFCCSHYKIFFYYLFVC